MSIPVVRICDNVDQQRNISTELHVYRCLFETCSIGSSGFLIYYLIVNLYNQDDQTDAPADLCFSCANWLLYIIRYMYRLQIQFSS